MANVFVILGIRPTSFLKEVKRAYYSRVLALGSLKIDSNADEFKTLNAAFELVNDETKLSNYFKLLQSNTNHQPLVETKNFNEQPIWLRNAKFRFAEVFIPIPVDLDDGNNKKSSEAFLLPHLKKSTNNFSSDFDFKHLAGYLNSRFQETNRFVGVTPEEAEHVVEHSPNYFIMAEVRIHFDFLKENEHSAYLSVLKNTSFSAENIISVQSMKNNSNNAQILKANLHRFWPSQLIVHNLKSEKSLLADLEILNNPDKILSLTNSPEKRHFNLWEAFYGDKILLNAITSSDKDPLSLSDLLISDLLKLQQFHRDKTTLATNKRLGDDYIQSINNFYTKALTIRLSDKYLNIQAKEIIDAAHEEFKHRDKYGRLAADVLMLVSILFAGLGLAIMGGRVLTNRTLFFSQAKTAREEDLLGRLNNFDDLGTDSLMRNG